MKTKKEIAENSLEIIENGCYTIEKNTVDVKNLIALSLEQTFTIAPDEWKTKLLNLELKPKKETAIEIEHISSLSALIKFQDQGKIAILNFASARNPGGGFMGGASAQEESLARSSSLYSSLIKDVTMYSYNKSRKTFLYSDYMIYSPSVVFWCDDYGNMTERPYFADVITSPAPNKGAMLNDDRISEIEEVESTFLRRIDHILCIALEQKVEILILGAWGCGVFRNETSLVANCFSKVINMKYKNEFKKIVFAIYSKDEEFIKSFKNAFIK